MENSCKGKKGGCLSSSDTGSTARPKIKIIKYITLVLLVS